MLQQKEELQETEIEIRYPEMTEKVSKMIRYIKQNNMALTGYQEDKLYQMSLDQVYYIETTDRKTFIYLENEVYESRKTIQAMESMLEGSTIIRIGKSTLLNISMLKGVKPYPNHRLLVELFNGEHVIVSRKYITTLKERIRREYGA
jgi:Response regulator of the LytR/AlgR family